jgi:hypothetical protein
MYQKIGEMDIKDLLQKCFGPSEMVAKVAARLRITTKSAVNLALFV